MKTQPFRLSRLIHDSGLSIAEFSRTVAGRDERTVRRWLAGEPIPAQVVAWLDRMESVTVSPETVVVTVRR